MATAVIRLAVAAFAALLLSPLTASAGDVTVSVSGGTLKVTGSPDADDLEIAGAGPSDVTVTSGLGTTVNGSGTAQLFPGADRGLKIDLKDGADELTIGSMSRANVAVKTGGGSDHVSFFETEFIAKAAIDLGGDNNALAICTTTLAKVTIKSGAPNDAEVDADCPINVAIGLGSDRGSAILIGDAHITGKLSVKMGQGLDVVGIQDVSALDDVKIAMGADSFSLGLCDVSVGGNLTFATGKPASGIQADFICNTADAVGEGAFALEEVSVTGTLKLKTGATSDDIVIRAISVGGKVTLDTGAGINDIDISNVGLLADLRAKSGAGPDTYLLDGMDVGGNAKFALGAGGNIFSSKEVEVDGNLSIKAGKDDDVISTVGITVGGTTKVDGGGGMDTIN